MKPENPLSRRLFVQGLGVAGAGALTAGSLKADDTTATDKPATKLLPTRKLGKNGPMLSMLALGGDMQATNATSLINAGWSLGYRYFDTAQKYGQQHEEAVYKRWFEQNPGRRKELFLVSKDYPKKGPEQLLEMIDKRLEALGTDYLDLFFIHQLCPEVYGKESVDWPKSERFRKVAETLKNSGKVRMVGFSCHGGPEYIQAAADGGYLDALMVQYTPFYEPGGAFDRALTTCHEKGMGLIAMKTLRHAGTLKSLRGLVLAGGSLKVSAEGFKHLSSLTELESIDFNTAGLTVENIAAIGAALPGLKKLIMVVGLCVPNLFGVHTLND